MTTLTLASIIFCEIERTYIFFLFALLSLSLSLRFCSHIFPYKMQRSTICYCTCDVKACLPYPYLSSWSVGMSLRYTCCCCMLLVVRRLTFFFFPAAAILFSFFLFVLLFNRKHIFYLLLDIHGISSFKHCITARYIYEIWSELFNSHRITKIFATRLSECV